MKTAPDQDRDRTVIPDSMPLTRNDRPGAGRPMKPWRSIHADSTAIALILLGIRAPSVASEVIGAHSDAN